MPATAQVSFCTLSQYKEGGFRSAANITAARNYCDMCIKFGGKWVRFNDWTQRAEFLYLKIGVRKVFRQKWCLERSEDSFSGCVDAIKLV